MRGERPLLNIRRQRAQNLYCGNLCRKKFVLCLVASGFIIPHPSVGTWRAPRTPSTCWDAPPTSDSGESSGSGECPGRSPNKSPGWGNLRRFCLGAFSPFTPAVTDGETARKPRIQPQRNISGFPPCDCRCSGKVAASHCDATSPKFRKCVFNMQE